MESSADLPLRVRQERHRDRWLSILYNDFISEGGKIWPRIKAVAEANNCVPHMQQVLQAAREAKVRASMPCITRYRVGDYASWKYIAPIQRAGHGKRRSFEFGTWGGEFRAENFVPAPGRDRCR